MEKVSIGTYSFGMDRGLDTREKLRRASLCGYKGIEFLTQDLDENDPENLKKWLEEYELSCVSYHGKMEELRSHIPIIAGFGAKLAVCPRFDFANEKEAKECARLLNENGRIAAEYGMRMGYHNHRQEFYKDERDKYLIEYILENTDPQIVYLQLDVGWAAAAGADCVAFAEKYHERIYSIHVKENNRLLGIEKKEVRSMDDPPLKRPDPSVMSAEEKREFFEKRKRSLGIQCPMGDPSSRIDWQAIKAALGKGGGECLWIVEREGMYDEPVEKCLKEDCEWLKNHL